MDTSVAKKWARQYHKIGLTAKLVVQPSEPITVGYSFSPGMQIRSIEILLPKEYAGQEYQLKMEQDEEVPSLHWIILHPAASIAPYMMVKVFWTVGAEIKNRVSLLIFNDSPDANTERERTAAAIVNYRAKARMFAVSQGRLRRRVSECDQALQRLRLLRAPHI